MKTAGKLGLGCAAVFPLLSAVGLGCYIGYELIVFDIAAHGLGGAPAPGDLLNGPFEAEHFIAFAALIACVVVVELCLTVILAVHASRDPRLPSWAVAIWVAGFLFAGPFALPLYVALYVLRDPTPRRVAALEQSPIAP